MTDKREQDALVAFIGGTSRTLEQWLEFARRDDCLDKMVPSDLRALLGALSRALTRPASGDAVEALRKIAEFECKPGTEDGAFFSCRLIAKTALTTEAPAQAGQGGERADLQGQKQSADTTATPPTSAQADPWEGNPAREGMPDDWGDSTSTGQAEAMALAEQIERIADYVHECGAPDYAKAVRRAAATLRQPASVEAEPVGWRYDWLDFGPSVSDNNKRTVMVSISKPDPATLGVENIAPLYAHPPAAAEPVGLLREARERGQREGKAAAISWLRDRAAMKPSPPDTDAALRLADALEQSDRPARALAADTGEG